MSGFEWAGGWKGEKERKGKERCGGDFLFNERKWNGMECEWNGVKCEWNAYMYAIRCVAMCCYYFNDEHIPLVLLSWLVGGYLRMYTGYVSGSGLS